MGIFGVYPRIPPFFGAGDGAFEDFEDASGTGNPKKSLNFGAGAGERISGIFPPLIQNEMNLVIIKALVMNPIINPLS